MRNSNYPTVVSVPTAECPHPTVTIPLYDLDVMPMHLFVAKLAGLDVDPIFKQMKGSD